MHRSRIIGAAVLFCFIVVAALQAGDELRLYKVKSGIVEYQVNGAQSGSETLYFDNWGMNAATFTNTTISMMGFTQTTNSLKLLDGEWTYNIDLDKKTGTKIETPLLKEMAQNAAAKNEDMTDVGEQMMVQMGGKKTGTETVLGKTADVWRMESMGTTIWVYKGVTLKIATGMAGMEITKTATRFDENAAVDPEKLKVPKDVTIGESQNLNEILERFKKK